MDRFVFLAVPMLFAATMGCSILLIPRFRDSSMRILAFFFLQFSVVLFCPLIIDSGVAYAPKFIQDLCALLFFVALLAIPPTLYYYVFELSIKEKEEELDIINLYFLPLCLLIINAISFVVLKKIPEDSTSFYFTVVQSVMEYSNFIAVLFLFPLMSFFYIYQSYKRYKTNRTKIVETYSYEEELNLKWTGSFIFGYVLFIAYVYLLQISSLTSLNFWIGIFTLIYLLFIGYKGYRQLGYNTEILEELQAGELSSSSLSKGSTSKAPFLIKKSDQPSTELSSSAIQPEEELISDEIRTKLKTDLLEYMERERPFLQQKLTISQLAKSIQTNNKYLSYVLNNDFDQNFVSFINSYRVQEAKNYLQSDEYSHIKIEVIGNMAGFRSKSSFNNAFKSITLETPSAYRKRIHKTS